MFPYYSSRKHTSSVFLESPRRGDSNKHTFSVFLESPRRGDSNKYTNRMFYDRKKNCSRVSVNAALDGSYQVSL